MSPLPTLLKVAQRRQDDLAVQAARVDRLVDELSGQVAALRAREQAEIFAAAGQPGYAALLPAYRQRVGRQIQELSAQLAARQAERAVIGEQLAAAYAEKSKFEQLISQMRMREEAERLAREQAVLDEIAINRAGSSARSS